MVIYVWPPLLPVCHALFVTNVCKFLIAPSCVAAGQFASQQGAAWARCMWGVGVGFSLNIPSLANVSAISFPAIPVWAITLCMCIKCGVQ